MKNKKIDMLNGPLVGKIVIFALPLALSSILQQLFNSADLAVVGRFDSDKAMAAVGSNSSLVNLIVSLFFGAFCRCKRCGGQAYRSGEKR